MHRFRHRLYTWIALFAMLAGALAPTISRAAAAGDENGVRYWLEVCSASGSNLIELGVADAGRYDGHGLVTVPPADGSDAPAHLTLDHCPYCGAQAGAAALPPHHPPPLVVASRVLRVPALFLLAPRPLFAWSPARPRAPPVLA